MRLFAAAKVRIFPVLPQKKRKKLLFLLVFLHNSIIITNFAPQIERLVLINKDSLQ
jgi:hypothetical protein